MIMQGEKDLEVAIETWDAEGLNRYITRPFMYELRNWSEQRLDLDNPNAQAFSSCHFALLDFQFYSLSYTEQDSISTRRNREERKVEYLMNLKACKQQLRK